MPKFDPPEFRRRAVELCRAGAAPGNVARDLGVCEATVCRWVAQEEADLGERPGTRSGEQAELLRARARIRELEAKLELVSG